MHSDSGRAGYVQMPCHLAALIPGDRLEQHRGQAGELAQQPVAQLE